jgi:hypothetical protein
MRLTRNCWARLAHNWQKTPRFRIAPPGLTVPETKKGATGAPFEIMSWFAYAAFCNVSGAASSAAQRAFIGSLSACI